MKLLLVFAISICALAQTTPSTRTAPDCGPLAFVFTSTGNSSDVNNVPQIASGVSIGGCSVWLVEADPFNSGAGTLAFQSASTSTFNGSGPGTYATFAGTTVTGTNPSSVFPWTYIATGYYPWVRVTASALTAGTIRGTIQGWRNPGAGSGGGGGGGGTISNLSTCLNGSNTLLTAPVSVTSAATTQIIAASAGKSITICSGVISMLDQTDLSLEYGTGSACGTGTTLITGSTGGFQKILGVGVDVIPLPASQAFCIFNATSTTIGGYVVYVQQ